MEVIDSDTKWEDRAFYFSGQLPSPVIARIWSFRSEDEYDSDENAETSAMNLIRIFAERIEIPAFLVLASDIGAPTALRSKKGVLWDHKELRQLRHIAFESECNGGNTRLGAIVELSRFGYDSAPSALLNWGQGLIVLATESLESLRRIAEQWVSADASDVLAFDYDAVAASLRQNMASGILRYLPPSNSRTETIVVVAHKNLVDDRVCKRFDAITESSKGSVLNGTVET